MNWISETVGKISLEVTLAEPGRDAGLLPVNCLLGELKERSAELPSAMAAAVDRAIAVVDRVFDSTGVFDEVSIKELLAWVSWMNTAVLDAMSERTPNTSVTPTGSEPSSAGSSIEPEFALDLERDGELLAGFCSESLEHLHNIEQGVLGLELHPDDAELLNTVFRAFHTFKGSAGFLNLRPVKQLAHELETVLDLARNGRLTVESEVIDVILAAGDTFRRFLDEIGKRLAGQHCHEPIRVATLDLLSRVRRITSPRVSSSSSERAVKRGGNGLLQSSQTNLPAGEESPKEVFKASPEGRPAMSSFVKVDTSKLESLIELVGEMVIARSQLTQDPDINSVKSERLNCNLARLTRITRELQRNAMALCMVPVRATFQKMKRIVRDLSGQRGKQVELCLHGEDTELDRGIVEEIGDPLIHMIRNSVDHGVESPADRVKAGKPAAGTIHLSAFHKGGNVVIQIRDDGRGLDADKIRIKAVGRGLISPTDRLTDDEIHRLIFAAGFSTAETVTEISGRGVGMDVVLRNVERLRGKIDIESSNGRGTTFTISLPLTLAIIDGLVVAIGEQRYILPTLAVRECLRPTNEMFATAQGKGGTLNLRGQLIPVLRMYEFYNLKSRTAGPTEAVAVVIANGNEALCLMVDELIGRQEVVIKGLGETFKGAPAIAGCTILGDGRVALIIDANSLVGLHGRSRAIAA